jgi:hypothetical protein
MLRSVGLFAVLVRIIPVDAGRKSRAHGTGTGDLAENATRSWYCPPPYVATECVKSDWIGWKNHKPRFQEKCNGNLVRWGQDSGVQDCGQACFACSFIRACCDDCTSIIDTTGRWVLWGCTDQATTYTLDVGVVVQESETWSRTHTWSTTVSKETTKSANVEVPGVGSGGSSMKLSLSSSYQYEQSFSHSWTVTQSQSESRSWVQPAGTCGWVWETRIRSTCGSRMAVSRNYQTTPRMESPCCMPLMNATSDPYGPCQANRAGEIINLCTGTVASPR